MKTTTKNFNLFTADLKGVHAIQDNGKRKPTIVLVTEGAFSMVYTSDYIPVPKFDDLEDYQTMIATRASADGTLYKVKGFVLTSILENIMDELKGYNMKVVDIIANPLSNNFEDDLLTLAENRLKQYNKQGI